MERKGKNTDLVSCLIRTLKEVQVSQVNNISFRYAIKLHISALKSTLSNLGMSTMWLLTLTKKILLMVELIWQPCCDPALELMKPVQEAIVILQWGIQFNYLEEGLAHIT